ncbi:MAG: response regulator transcription factor [Armatimonadetes bacterium]|nr:response regulator transcription factor [Armatimonadota bacterium]
MVEDEPAYRAFLRVVVADSGTELVGEAGTASEGRRLVSRLQPDVVTVDVQLPDGNGLDLAEELRNAQKGVHVIVATASSDPGCVTRAISANASAYLLKPFSRSRGAATIREVLALPEVPAT